MNGITEFREGQLQSSERMVNSTASKMVLQAPTGTGKSVMVRVPGLAMGQRTLILTRTLLLQKQYEDQGIASLLGRSNYICTLEPMLSAAEGACRLGDHCQFIHDDCPYFGAKGIAQAANTSVLNYAYFFRDGTFTDYDWIMCDEGHAVPAELTNAFQIHFSTYHLYELKIDGPKRLDSIPMWIEWGKANAGKLKRKAKTILRSKAPILHAVNNSVQRLESIRDLSNWVIESNNASATIRPIWPMDLARDVLFNAGRRFVFTSATIDPIFTMRMLGVDPESVDVIRMDSQFPIGNRPIYATTAEYYPSHRAPDSEYARLIAAIDEIVECYPNQRGVIHTGNYELANRIIREARTRDRFVFHDSQTRALALKVFKATEAAVLVSPSIAEGVDLPYDQCEFNVIAKVPYANLKDPVWVARFESNPELAQFAYTSEAISLIVQACGRGVRSKDDRCDTFILDHSFIRELDRNGNMFPAWFIAAIQK